MESKEIKLNESVFAYVCKKEKFSFFEDLPDFMQTRVKHIKDEGAKEQKRCSYGLLAYALQEALWAKWSPSEVYLSETGKPMAKGYYFSICHTTNVVAVALAKSPVGIDVERVDRALQSTTLSHILHENERLNSSLPPAIALFTQKEAIFKKEGKARAFLPQTIDTTTNHVQTTEISLDEEKYYLSVAADDVAIVKPVILGE